MKQEFSTEKAELVKQAKAFAKEHFVDGDFFDREERFPEEIRKAAANAGFFRTFIPKAYGGLEMGFLAHTLVMEEFWRVDPGIGNILLTTFGAELLMAHGNEEQKGRWLPSIAGGEAISCCAITEPDAGSDIFGLSTSALAVEGGFLINGTKQFITTGNRADLIMVLAVTNPTPERRTGGFSFFVAEKGMPGLSASPMKGKLGIRGSETAELTFNDLFIPKENLLGKIPGAGFSQVMNLFNINRLFACGQGVGVAQGALDMLLAHLKENPEIASAQTTQFRLAEMAALVEAAKQLYIWAGINLDEGRIDPGLVAMAKLFCGETGLKTVKTALSLFGPTAASGGHPLSRFYRDAKIVEIYEGAKDLEKLTIARQLLAGAGG